jgi:uncharacterized protein YlxW (UPF0749 family)
MGSTNYTFDGTRIKLTNPPTERPATSAELDLHAQLQAAQAERDELQRERDALREALEQVRADYSFMDSFVQGRVHRALRASTPNDEVPR